MQHSPFWEATSWVYYKKKFLPFRNCKFNLACLQQPANGFYPDPDESCLYGTPSLTYLVYNGPPIVSTLIQQNPAFVEH